MTSHIRRLAIVLFLLTTPLAVNAQTQPVKEAPQKTEQPAKRAAAKRERPDPLAAERRAAVVTLATALADEARGFRDEQLRARVLMRTADALWATSEEQARAFPPGLGRRRIRRQGGDADRDRAATSGPRQRKRSPMKLR